MASTLLREGCDKLFTIVEEMKIWMEQYEYESVEQMKGCMSSASVADPTSFERANYIRILQSFRADKLG
jgi:dihydroorotate dehydrogenase (fumarate)